MDLKSLLCSCEFSLSVVTFLNKILNLFTNPLELILGDEASSGLDEINKNDFINLLMNLCNEEKVTLVMSSHDISLKKNFDMSINLETILL